MAIVPLREWRIPTDTVDGDGGPPQDAKRRDAARAAAEKAREERGKGIGCRRKATGAQL